MRDVMFADGIYIGNQSEAFDYDLMKRHNIKYMLCVAEDGELPKYDDIVTTKFGMSDPKEGLANNNYPESAAKLLDILYDLRQLNGGNIFVYCISGHNRSSLVVAIWLTNQKPLQSIPFRLAVEYAGVKDCKNWMKHLGYTFLAVEG